MKTFRYLVVAAVAVPVLAGPGLAQTGKPAAPPVAASEDASKAAVKTVAGELAAVASLAPLKPGDPIKVTYVEMGAKRIMKSIVKG